MLRTPASGDWLHEIKHDRYRMVARRDSAGVHLFTRNGHDWTVRFPLVVEAVNALKIKSARIKSAIIGGWGDMFRSVAQWQPG